MPQLPQSSNIAPAEPRPPKEAFPAEAVEEAQAAPSAAVSAATFWQRVLCTSCATCTLDTAADTSEQFPITYVQDERDYPIESKEALPLVKLPQQQDPRDDVLVERPKMEVADGAWYKGQWRGTQCHGYGIMTRIDSSWYEGTFKDGKEHGFGKCVAVNGEVYEGQWDVGQAHGHGKYVHEDGGTYDGDWTRGEKCGLGTECWADGSSYEGQYYKGLKHGHGMYISSCGALSFKGSFQQDMMHGEGIYYFGDGRKYVGQWQHGRMHGTGVMEWPDGHMYRGVWVEGRTENESEPRLFSPRMPGESRMLMSTQIPVQPEPYDADAGSWPEPTGPRITDSPVSDPGRCCSRAGEGGDDGVVAPATDAAGDGGAADATRCPQGAGVGAGSTETGSTRSGSRETAGGDAPCSLHAPREDTT